MVSSNLTNRTHYVSLSNHCSAFAHAHSGVPQGSVIGSILLTMYIKPLSAIIDSHSTIHHSFEDTIVLLSLQRLNCIHDHCAYVHGLVLS